MAFIRVIVTCLGLILFLSTVYSAPVPDSAGIVEMIPGLAYGGIPYGSVSGRLAEYVPGVKQAYYPTNIAPVAVVNPIGY